MLEILLNIYIEFLNAFLKNPLAQSFGIFAYLITLFTFIFLKDKNFIFGNLISSIFWGFHYLFLGYMPASFINFFDVLKNAFALKFEKKKYFFFIFIVSYLLIGFFTYENFYSLFPISAVLFSSFLVFYVRGIKLKLGFLFVLGCWFVYNLYAMSIGGILSDLTLIISLFIGIFKDFKEKKVEIQ